MNYAKWIEHFTRNKQDRPEPDWSVPVNIPPAVLAPVLRSIEQFRLGDGGGPASLIAFDRENFRSRTNEMRQIVDLWFAEEAEHARLLGCVVRRFGGRIITSHWSFTAFCLCRRVLGVRFELQVLTLTELVSTAYYRILRNHSPDGPLAAMCELILRDEAGHVAFQCDRLVADGYPQTKFARLAVADSISSLWLHGGNGALDQPRTVLKGYRRNAWRILFRDYQTNDALHPFVAKTGKIPNHPCIVGKTSSQSNSTREMKIIAKPKSPVGLISVCRYVNASLMVFVSLFFFLIPGVTVVQDLSDPNIRSAEIPRSAWRLHQTLSPKLEEWARARLGSNRAAKLSTSNISGTEWPLFGAVFYLWSTESLQNAWEKDHSAGVVAPNIYAKDAIEAATSLVIDPTQANWVKIHWGENYLKTENVFYRMLVISALTSHAQLTGEKQYLPLLRDQTDSLSAELEASRHGWLDDYPNECYPGDVLTAIAMIHKADKVLGTDHSVFVKALADVKLSLRLIESFRTEPFLISELVRIAMFEIALQPIYEGLAEHRWSDEQLVALDAELTKLDFLADYQSSMRGERAMTCATIDFLSKKNTYQRYRELFNSVNSEAGDDGGVTLWGQLNNKAKMVGIYLMPAGWFTQNKLFIARGEQGWITGVIFPEKHLASPQKYREVEQAETLSIYTSSARPWNFLAKEFYPALGASGRKSSREQISVDLARTAIALERYRLAHGEFPESLDVLAPQFIAQVPHDVIGGQPLKYRREANGQFILYSVGWNETDDGGVIGHHNGGVAPYFEAGDWVWRYPAK